jgi:hypothetical protein
MHLGAYGQAYFAAETMEIVSGKFCYCSTPYTCAFMLCSLLRSPKHCGLETLTAFTSTWQPVQYAYCHRMCYVLCCAVYVSCIVFGCALYSSTLGGR